MQTTKLARRYAQGIYSWTEENGCTSVVVQEMKQIISILKGSPELEKFFNNPVVPSRNKFAVLSEVFKFLSPSTTKILELVLRQKRERELANIARSFIHYVEMIHGVQRVELTTATILTEDIKSKILSSTSLINENYSTLDIKEIIDPSILGGYILRIGDRQIDASVSSRLERIKKEFQQH